MSSFSLLQNTSIDLGIVLVKFDHQLGPLVLFNESKLEEKSLMNLAIKGTSTLMNGLPYSMKNTRRFRGLLQVSNQFFAYGFDLVLLDDKYDDSFTPLLLFLIFPTSSVPVIGSNIRTIEHVLYESTQSLNNLSSVSSDFGSSLLTSVKNALF
jgi:hypothetical protein